MTICAKCHNEIPELKLACPLCVQEASDRALLLYQQHYLRAVAAGEVELRVARMRNHEQHVAMFGDEERAFCKLDLTGYAVERRYRLSYSGDNMRDICAECRELVDKGIQAATE